MTPGPMSSAIPNSKIRRHVSQTRWLAGDSVKRLIVGCSDDAPKRTKMMGAEQLGERAVGLVDAVERDEKVAQEQEIDGTRE